MRFGKTLIVSDCDAGIEPLLLPLLACQWRAQGGRAVICVGEKSVDISPRFTLVLTARTPPAALPAAHAALVTVVNFTATRSGLQGQLLSATLQAAAPELETRRGELIRAQGELEVAQRACEAALLSTLAQSRGNLLENGELLAQLSDSKARASAIEASLSSGRVAGEEVEALRARYAPLASAGARLYFGLRALKVLCPMYDFGLEAFLRVFGGVLRDPSLPGALEGSVGGGGEEEGGLGGLRSAGAAAAAPQLSLRMRGLIAGLAWRALGVVLRACHKADRAAAALHCLHSIFPQVFGGSGSGGGAGEWAFFLGETAAAALGGSGSGSGSGGAASSPPGLPLWLPAERESALRALTAASPVFITALDLGAAAVWGAWAISPAPEASGWPASALRAGTPWQRLCLVHALRPDRTLQALSGFVGEALEGIVRGESGGGGEQLQQQLQQQQQQQQQQQWQHGGERGGLTAGRDPLAPAGDSICALAGEASAAVPVLFVTTVGTDPSRELRDYAAGALKEGALVEIAMSGGSGEEALARLAEGVRVGQWVCLKNLHLVTSWLPALEAALRALTSPTAPRQPHADFRLWLLGDSHEGWPPSLLHRCLIVMVEAPPGMRANVCRTYESWGVAAVEGSGSGSGSGSGAAPSASTPDALLYNQLTFLLAWLHGILQERRAYLPQGWTQAYEFSSADLRAGCAVVRACVEACKGKERDIPWAFLVGLLECSVYGGRVDHPGDTRVLRACLSATLHGDVLCGRRAFAPGLPVCPPAGALGVYARLAAALPSTDSTALFGLPANIHRATTRAQHSALLARLKLLRGVAATQGGAQASPSAHSAAAAAASATLQALQALWQGCPALPPAAHAPPPMDDCPVAAVLRREEHSARALCERVGGDLKGLALGQHASLARLAGVAAALATDTVPEAWEALWKEGDAGSGAVEWVRGVLQRLCAPQRAQGGGVACSAPPRSSSAPISPALAALLSRPVPLGAYFHPRAILTALRQASARAFFSAGLPDCGMASLRLCALWSEGDVAPLAAQCKGALLPLQCAGLQLQGALWNAAQGVIMPPSAESSDLCPLPTVSLVWLPSALPQSLPPACSVGLPLYTSPSRAHTLAQLALPFAPSQDPPAERAQWALAGAALFLDA